MLINGVNILLQKTIFKTTWYGILIIILMLISIFIFLICSLIGEKKWADILIILCFLGFIYSVILTSHSTSKTFLNQPCKIEYTIEVTDANAWKELGPNYTVKEKVYENKEIYIIEGDYVK